LENGSNERPWRRERRHQAYEQIKKRDGDAGRGQARGTCCINELRVRQVRRDQPRQQQHARTTKHRGVAAEMFGSMAV
jgi:hypothetical protein